MLTGNGNEKHVSVPLSNPEPDEEKIRLHAYFLWEEQGRPEGRDLEHWKAAQEYVKASQHHDPDVR
jgi:Protein of unknown function (DUF2934)